jgi:hypothetical protein
MLDAQRYKANTYRVEVRFTRFVLWMHLGLGIIVFFLMLLHEVFAWAVGVATWYLVTMLLMLGMLSAVRICRVIMGVAFLLFTISGIYFLGQVLPQMKPEQAPIIPHILLPFWLGVTNIVYAFGGVCMLTSPKVKKACTVYFSLW